METTHTPGKIEVHEIRDGYDNGVVSRGIRRVDGKGLNTGEDYEMFSEADAERLVACWNACAGMSDPEATITALAAAAREIVERHDGMARAANFTKCGCDNCTPFRAALTLLGDK